MERTRCDLTLVAATRPCAGGARFENQTPASEPLPRATTGIPTTFAALLLLGTGSAVLSASGEELAQELKKVSYQILFESYQDQNWDLCLVRADGAARVNLTRTPDVHELYPHASADGTKVCFLVDAGEGEKTTRDVYRMNVDGTGRQFVARGARDPCWTADDKGLVYVKSEFEQFTLRDFVTKGVFVYDLASRRERQHPNPDLVHLFAVCATPDGKWYIASVHGGMGYSHAILAIEAQGRKVFNLKVAGRQVRGLQPRAVQGGPRAGGVAGAGRRSGPKMEPLRGRSDCDQPLGGHHHRRQQQQGARLGADQHGFSPVRALVPLGGFLRKPPVQRILPPAT